ncbi:type I restriction-modification system subunit M [Candidatus Palauibacter sp.]|uniref:type I restriction-modification system subunit M n=1 Tax=Candidatus Palauibacter sp. TaxID=3101350 RepID=UPI003B01D224
MTHTEIVSFIWDVANLIRDTFKRGKYQDVILPLTVLRRLDCVLAPTKEKVLARKAELRGMGLEDMDAQLKKASGFAFYNTSRYLDFQVLLADAPALAANLRNYIVGFSDEMREVIERFDFDNTISKLDESQLLYQVVERFGTLDLHPDVVDNPTMGTIFEELIRKFNEALDENPGEHFTPRDVVHLMVELMLAGDEEELTRPGTVRTVYDPCCGSGGMLMIAKQHILEGRPQNGKLMRPPINRDAEVHLFGQEVNPETWAVSKSDFFMKDPTGHDASNIAFGSVLSNDRHADRRFDYLIANPPYGKDWKRDKDAVKAEHERGAAGRFGPGLPRISDGQTLFLLHMLARARTPEEGGTRIAIIMNGSPLFTGDAGSGESEIRRHILENDLLEALIALPEQLFYNTGIGTYIWLLTNRKAPERAGKVQLSDATSFWTPRKKSLGDKRRDIPAERAADIVALLRGFRDGETRPVLGDDGEEDVPVSRVFPATRFGFRKITVERPLRLNFQASEERIARLDEQTAFANLARSRRRGEAGERAKAEGRALQTAIKTALESMPDDLYKGREAFAAELDAAMEKAEINLRVPVRKAILKALSERDETAEICRDAHGHPEPDPELRDTERVPLPDGDDPADEEGVPRSVREFFDREVKPHADDAWIDTTKRDRRDGEVGLVGYEINFNRYFYRFKPPRPLEEIEADIGAIGAEIVEMLREVARIPYGSES